MYCNSRCLTFFLLTMSSSIDTTLGFHGLSLALAPTNEWEQPGIDEVSDDIEGEQDALSTFKVGNINKEDLNPGLGGDSKDQTSGNLSTGISKLEALNDTLMSASKGVSDKTDGEYKGFVKACTTRLTC